MDFLYGVLASIVAAFVCWLCVKVIWPYFQDRYLYQGIRIDGLWIIHSIKDDKEHAVGKLTIKQQGSRLTGSSYRSETRQGLPSDRVFVYSGRIVGDKVLMTFEDARGESFDFGSYVFSLHNDGIVMHGMATFHGKPEGMIISEKRILKKTPAPPERL